MKYILSFLLLLSAFAVKSQYPLTSFKDTITTWLPNDTIAGIPLLRKAQYECLIDNRRTGTVSIQVRVFYYTADTIAFSLVPAKSVELIADQNGYVHANGDWIGTLSDVQTQYGVYDSISQQWSYTVPGIMPEGDFYVYVSTIPLSMRELIVAALTKSTKLKQR